MIAESLHVHELLVRAHALLLREGQTRCDMRITDAGYARPAVRTAVDAVHYGAWDDNFNYPPFRLLSAAHARGQAYAVLGWLYAQACGVEGDLTAVVCRSCLNSRYADPTPPAWNIELDLLRTAVEVTSPALLCLPPCLLETEPHE